MSAFALQLQRPLIPNEVGSLVAAVGVRLKGDLPMSMDLTSAQIEFSGAEQLKARIEKGGFVLQRMSPSGGIEWRLEINGNRVLVQSHSYTDWDADWPKARGYLAEVMGVATSIAPDIRIQTLTLGVLDKFSHPDSAKSYSCLDLFKEDCPYLTRKVRTAGELWHVFQGWFDEPPDIPQAKILNVLQITSKHEEEGSATGKTMRELVTMIDHNIHFLFHDQMSWATLLGGDPGLLNSIFLSMHKKNKDVLMEMLQPTILKEIGLQK